jgi:hypothetical protein
VSAGDNARDMHADALGWEPRRQGSPLHQAHAAADKRLSELQDLAARTGQGSLILQDPRDLAARVGGMAAMANVEMRPQASTWAQIIAVALAGWCSASLSETLDISSGDAA